MCSEHHRTAHHVDERAWSDLPVDGSEPSSDREEPHEPMGRPRVALIVVDTSVLVDDLRNGTSRRPTCSMERTTLY